MKARLLVGRNGRSAGEVIEHVQPGTQPGMIPRECAEWFNDDEVVKPISAKAAEKKAAEADEPKKRG